MEKTKVVFVDDHQIIINGVQTILQNASDIDLCGVASDGEQAIKMVLSQKPDVLITDISMPGMNGIELTQKIAQLCLPIKVLVLTMYTQDDFIFSALRAGATGIISKQETTREILISAIKAVREGKEYFSPGIAGNMIKNLVNITKRQDKSETHKLPCLTRREIEVLKLYVEGYSNQQIADSLYISIRTVETHKNNIMRKFNFKSSVEMVKFALRNNLVTI